MTASELKSFENSISAFGSHMPTANSAAYNPVVEEQERLLSQFQFGGQLPNSIASGGMGQPMPSQGVGPEKCPMCAARFSDVADLIMHTEQAHPSPGSQAYVPP